MFELCDRLFGIYKVKNCTSATYIAPNLLEFDEKKKINNRQHNDQQQHQQQSTLQSQLGNATSNQHQIEMIEA